jgi:NAD(P)-dependent dehydrogenase (short-subunit alcohol dehydrogenase family)
MHYGARYPDLAGRKVLVTGGATGIGAAIVAAYREQNSEVGFLDLDDKAGSVLAADSGARFRVCDVRHIRAFTSAIDELSEILGGIDILVNNVANDERHDPTSLDWDAWRNNLSINLDPVMFASQRVFQGMKSRGSGSVVNLSSINAVLAPESLVAYNTAKAGIVALTKTLARAWGQFGVRVNAVSPGWVVTERQMALWLSADAERDWMKQVALKRRIVPADVARLVLFLSSDESAAITGQNFVIDGGRI